MVSQYIAGRPGREQAWLEGLGHWAEGSGVRLPAALRTWSDCPREQAHRDRLPSLGTALWRILSGRWVGSAPVPGTRRLDQISARPRRSRGFFREIEHRSLEHSERQLEHPREEPNGRIGDDNAGIGGD